VIGEPLDFNRLHDPSDPSSPPVKRISLRSGAGPASTTIRMADEPASPDRSSVFIFRSGEDEGSRLEGFTIAGGKGSVTGDPPFLYGGAILCIDGSSPRVADCRISGNLARYGSGAACIGSAPILLRCGFSGNVAEKGGGGLFLSASAAELVDCTIEENKADTGGGASCDRDSNAALINCRIVGNRASAGGGLSCWLSSPALINCTLAGNLATEEGGGGISCAGSSPTLINCIIWDNIGGSIARDAASSPSVTTSCVDTGDYAVIWPGEGNIAVDPRFVEPGGWDDGGTPQTTSDDVWLDGDYRLQAGSPAIDAGACDGAPGFDILGNARPAGAGCDMGAFEHGAPAARPFMRGDASADGVLDVGDAVTVLMHLFASGRAPACAKTADADEDGRLTLGDPILELNYLFANGRPLPPPLQTCGLDPTADRLTCEAFPACP